MNTFVKSLGVIVALTLILTPFSNGEFLQGKHIKSSAKQLNPLERFLIRAFKPELPLDEILAQEAAADTDAGTTVQDGYVEWWNIDLPLFLMQLNKMGDQVVFPTFSYPFGISFCYMGVCAGIDQVHSFRKPVLKGVRSAGLDFSVNGTQLRLHYQIPEIVGNDPLYTHDQTEWQNSPPKSENELYENATLFVTNFSILTTANLEIGLGGLEISNLNIEWAMDDLRFRFENGTRTYNDSSQEPLGEKELTYHEEYIDSWYDDSEGESMKVSVERSATLWLNCFLSDGRNGGSICEELFSEPLNSQSFAELIQAFGLDALNKARAAEQ